MEKETDKKKALLKEIVSISSIGINLVLCTFLGFIIGYWLDKKSNSSPLFTIIFLIFGIILGFIFLVRLALKKNDQDVDNSGR